MSRTYDCTAWDIRRVDWILWRKIRFLNFYKTKNLQIAVMTVEMFSYIIYKYDKYNKFNMQYAILHVIIFRKCILCMYIYSTPNLCGYNSKDYFHLTWINVISINSIQIIIFMNFTCTRFLYLFYNNIKYYI